MKRVLRATLKWGLVAFLCFVVVLVLFYWEEDWRGARDWANCQKELAAKGEILDLRTLCPPGNPKDDLSKVPIFAEEYEEQPLRFVNGVPQEVDYKPRRLDRIHLSLGNLGKEQPKSNSYYKNEPIDLDSWARYFRSIPEADLSGKAGSSADDVLAALTQMEPEWSEVVAALSNPNAFWPLDYERPFNITAAPQVKMLALCKILTIKAAADLSLKKNDLAEQDYLLTFNLNRILTKNSLLVSYLIACADRAVADEILWDGVRRHSWSAAQLRQIDSSMAAADLLRLAVKTFRIERAEGIQNIAALQIQDQKMKELLIGVYGPKAWYFFQSRPSGWWNEDRKEYCDFYQSLIESFDLNEGSILRQSKSPVFTNSRALVESVVTPWTRFAKTNLNGILAKIAESETHRRLTIIACRLEEYYLEHKEYPDALNELGNLPPHLNEEVLTGRPMHYGRKGNSYFLYSTGWDGKDRGGIPKGPLTGDNYDWIWPGP